MIGGMDIPDEGEVTEIKIEIDFGDYDGRNDGKNLPHGKKGMSYPVFACTATDNLGNDAESVLVTVANDSGKLIPQTNGRFATETAGKYTVKYDAVSGSVSATRTLTITVDEYVDNISYDNGGENVPTTGTTGSAVFVRFGDFGGGTGELEPFMRLTRDLRRYRLCRRREVRRKNRYHNRPRRAGYERGFVARLGNRGRNAGVAAARRDFLSERQ